MATKSLSLRYGLAAVVVALAIIGTSLYVGNPVTPTGGGGFTSFAVMLTDPPTVPRGTSELNVTYSSIQVHVVSSSGSLSWEAAQESGRVNLLSLVNVTKTIASLSLPTGSTVDKLQFALSSATANVSGVVYPVTLLDDQLVVPIRSTKLNGTGTGALIDLRPTLLEINATNSTGGLVKYFVLSPSATAVVQGSVDEAQSRVGCMVHLKDKVKDELTKEYIRASHNVTVTSSTLKVDGNVTTLSVTVKNIGSANATLSGLSLMGQFNSTFSWSVKVTGSKGKLGGMIGGMWQSGFMMRYHPEAIPFKVQGDKLVPLFGDFDKVGGWGTTRTVIKPDQSMTLTYSGVIQIRSDGRGKSASVVVTPLVGKGYKLWVTSMGAQSFNVVAAAG
jgi:hypothetical protein